MTTLRLWPATDGPASPSADPVDYTLGTEFEVTEECDFTAWHWWCQTNATVSFGLYRVDSPASGTLLASVAGVAVVAGGWRRTAAAAPVALTPGDRYRVVVFSTTDGFYCTTPNYWSSGGGSAGIVNGALEAPNAAGATGGDQGSFTATVGVMTFPTDSFNATNYWIDVEVETAAEPVNHPATGTVSIVTSTAGTATADHSAAGTVSVVTSAQGTATTDHTAQGTISIVTNTMGSPGLGGTGMSEPPCNWVASYAGCPGGLKPEVLASLPASGVDFEKMAAEYLWNWTNRMYGVCEITVQPCRQDCTEGISTFNGSGPIATPLGIFNSPWTPVLIDGLWFNIGCGRCGDKCGCDGSAPLKLPGPIESVAEVSIDGVVLDPMAYYVNNHNLLIRADGSPWPKCGMEITYSRGTPVPIGGQIAMGVFAAELAKAACRDKTCQLPQRVQSVTRQNVSVVMLDAFDDIDKGHTGIWLIDSWVASVTKPPARSQVISPDKSRSPIRRKTWPST